MKMLGSPIIADDNHAEDRARATEGPEKGVDVAPEQTSYLSQISQIIFVEKKLSCGEISAFYTEFEQFMEFYRSFCCFCSKSMWRKICAEKICVEKKMTNMRSAAL